MERKGGWRGGEDRAKETRIENRGRWRGGWRVKELKQRREVTQSVAIIPVPCSGI